MLNEAGVTSTEFSILTFGHWNAERDNLSPEVKGRMTDIYDDCKIVKKKRQNETPPDLAMYYVIKTLATINSVFCVIYDLIHIVSKE